MSLAQSQEKQACTACDQHNVDSSVRSGSQLHDELGCNNPSFSDSEKVHCYGSEESDQEALDAENDAEDNARKIIDKLTPPQRAAFHSLEQTFRHFVDVQVTGRKLYVGGYGSDESQPYEWADFYTKVSEAGEDLKLTSPGYAAADAQLNLVYKRLRAETGLFRDQEEASQSNLVLEERTWINYRDAWARFGSVLQPKIPKEKWLQWITEARVRDLTEIDDVLREAKTASVGIRSSSTDHKAPPLPPHP